MGAVKPPWITKSEFYHMPFNYCDRWCERCDLTSICKVFKESERDRQRAIKEGKNPDSLEFAFEVMHRNFQETIKLLNKGAKKWGIDMSQIEKEVREADWDMEEIYKSHPLYQSALLISAKLSKLLQELEVVPIEVDVGWVEEIIEVISWYRPFILAKIARACSKEKSEIPELQEIEEFDARNSAFLANNGILETLSALEQLEVEKSMVYLRSRIKKLDRALRILSESLDEEFLILPKKS